MNNVDSQIAFSLEFTVLYYFGLVYQTASRLNTLKYVAEVDYKGY